MSNNFHNELFIETIADIRAKLDSGRPYDLIRASGLLRQLLLDDSPLLHKVNSKYKIKFLFRCHNKLEQVPGLPEPDMHWINIADVGFPKKVGPWDLNLEQFLGWHCLLINGHKFTVKDIIKACANVKGGVHLGSAKDEKEKAILDLDHSIQIAGSEVSTLTLSSILQVTLVAIEPLRSAIVIDIAHQKGI